MDRNTIKNILKFLALVGLMTQFFYTNSQLISNFKSIKNSHYFNTLSFSIIHFQFSIGITTFFTSLGSNVELLSLGIFTSISPYLNFKFFLP